VQVARIGCDGVVGAAEPLGGDGVSLFDAVVLLPGAGSIVDIDVGMIDDRSATFRNLLARRAQAIFVRARQSAACSASHLVEARLSHWLLHARDRWDGAHCQ
jgi:hypothetical protein